MRMQLRLFLFGVVTVVGAVASAQVSPTQKPAISLTISAAQQTLKAGTVLSVKATLVNNSDQNISLWWESGEGVPYRADVRHVDDQKPAPLTRFGIIRSRRFVNGSIDLSGLTPRETSRLLDHSGRSFSLKPGEATTEEFDVSKHYDLSTPGEYAIQLMVPQIPETKGEFKSNVITISVNP